MCPLNFDLAPAPIASTTGVPRSMRGGAFTLRASSAVWTWRGGNGRPRSSDSLGRQAVHRKTRLRSAPWNHSGNRCLTPSRRRRRREYLAGRLAKSRADGTRCSVEAGLTPSAR
jgi:hypothetical protein